MIMFLGNISKNNSIIHANFCLKDKDQNEKIIFLIVTVFFSQKLEYTIPENIRLESLFLACIFRSSP